MTSRLSKTIEDIIDDDPIPWYKFPLCAEEEKTLSHVSTYGGQHSDLVSAVQVNQIDQAPQYPFQGQWGTTFQPPGFEREDIVWHGMFAKHVPPGLAVPTHILNSSGFRWCYSHPEPAHKVGNTKRSEQQISPLPVTIPPPPPEEWQEPERTPLICGRSTEEDRALDDQWWDCPRLENMQCHVSPSSEKYSAEYPARDSEENRLSNEEIPLLWYPSVHRFQWPQRWSSTAVWSDEAEQSNRVVSNSTSDTSLVSATHFLRSS